MSKKDFRILADIWLEMYSDPFVDSDEVFRLFYKFTSLFSEYYPNFSSKKFDKYFTKGIKKIHEYEENVKREKERLEKWKIKH